MKPKQLTWRNGRAETPFGSYTTIHEDVAGLLGNTTTVALRAYVDISAESERLRTAAKKV